MGKKGEPQKTKFKSDIDHEELDNVRLRITFLSENITSNAMSEEAADGLRYTLQDLADQIGTLIYE